MQKQSKKYTVLIWLVLILCGVAIPALFIKDGGIPQNWDISFHIARFNGLCAELKNGVYFPYYLSTSYLGQGYLTGVFYGWLFLYPFAALTLLGVSQYAAFLSMLFFYGIAFSVIVYKAALAGLNELDIASDYTPLKMRGLSLVIAILSTFDPYRIRLLLYRGSIGEWLAMLWIPLIAYGVILLFKKNRILPLALSMSALCYTHSLSLFIAVLVLFVVFAIKWKSVFANRGEVLKSTIKAAGICILLSAAFILPFVQSIKDEDLLFEHRSYGCRLNAYYFDVLPDNTVGIVIGIVLVIGFVLWIAFRRKTFSRILQLSLLPIFFYTNLVPWKLLQYTPLAIIQFPWRFMILMPIIYFLLILNVSRLSEQKLFGMISVKGKSMKFLGVVALVYCILLTACMVKKLNIGYQWETLPLVTEENMDTIDDIGLFEYLPVELAQKRFDRSISESQNMVSCSSLRELNGDNADVRHIDAMTYDYTLKTNNASTIILDKVYYHGFIVSVNGKPTEYRNRGGLISVDNVKGNGIIRLEYQKNTGQILGLLISTVTSVMLVMSCVIFRKKKESGQYV